MALSFYNTIYGLKACLIGFKTAGARKFASEPSPKKPEKAPEGIRQVTKLDGMSKWALVFSGKYKTSAEIPTYVSIETLQRARSKARIKLSNIFMAITALACLGYAYSGRQAASRGESISGMNREWHKEYREKVDKEKNAQN